MVLLRRSEEPDIEVQFLGVAPIYGDIGVMVARHAVTVSVRDRNPHVTPINIFFRLRGIYEKF
jgi:hypothetical protein